MTKVTNPPSVMHDLGVEIDGKPVKVIDARGSHNRLVTRAMDGDSEAYLPSLMHVLLRVDGNQLAPSEWEALPMQTYNKVMKQLMEMGFMVG